MQICPRDLSFHAGYFNNTPTTLSTTSTTTMLTSLPIVAFIFSSVILGATELSPGCGTPIPSGVEPGHSSNHTINSHSGASSREYRIHIPESYLDTVPVPLIISYHGRGTDMKFQEQLSQFSNASFGFEGISVYPQGILVLGSQVSRPWSQKLTEHVE
jgi:poly(3-hydroxybutyrate) depolymerase